MVTKEYLEYPLQLLQHGAAMVLPYLEKVREVEWTPWVVSGIGLGLSLISFVAVRALLKRMTPPQYSEEAREQGMRTSDQMFVEDIIVNGIEEAVFNETMTKKKSHLIYKYLGEKLELNGLIRKGRAARKLHPYRVALLKDEISARLAHGDHKTPANLPKEPVLKREVKNKALNAAKLNAILGIA